MFLVVILFGIGMDYCIFLFNCFCEELVNGYDKIEVMIMVYCIVGRMLFISGIVVFIGFVVIGFVKFVIF